jgi:HD-GYP domain-containing protein (c-di-GMP phosphodiesterase class II)
MTGDRKADDKHYACLHCGRSIVGIAHVRENDGYCCEHCYLDTRRGKVHPGPHDDAARAVAEALAAALDARERETGLHSKRVACHTLVLAKRFTTDAETLRQVYWGALLHDIGKIGIPDSILRKNGPLTAAEWEVMRMHPDMGHRILSDATFLADAAKIVLCHEERYDGSGYPHGLAGEAIPLWARLFAVIDTLDAITSDRPYRKGVSFDDARAEIVRQAHSQFDPLAVDAFLAEEETLRAMVDLKCGAVSAGNLPD